MCDYNNRANKTISHVTFITVYSPSNGLLALASWLVQTNVVCLLSNIFRYLEAKDP